VVDWVAQRHGTTELAKAYPEYLYTPKDQEVVARNFCRPRDPAVAAKYKSQFPSLPLLMVDEREPHFGLESNA
jgi:sulfate transport system substrate-binding protein